ncbi:MAG: amino acid permease, partial [archaeon]|nr:amino acid permease [archaeon]
PNILSKVHKKRGTPWVAILFTMAISSLFALIGDIELVANVTNFTTFLVFFAVNLALISLRRKRINKKEAFKSPLTILNVPVLAVFGALSSFIMLLQFDLLIVAIATLVIGLGAIFYKFFLKRS